MDQPIYFARSFSYYSSASLPRQTQQRGRASSDARRPSYIPSPEDNAEDAKIRSLNKLHTLRRTSTFGGYFLSERPDVPTPILERVHSGQSEKEVLDQIEQNYSNAAPTADPEKLSDTISEVVAFPEGGRQAWLVVFGSWCNMFVSFGLLNTTGFFQAYLSENQLQGTSNTKLGWIFSVFAFLLFFGGIEVGHLFDRYGPRWLIFAGSCLTLVSLFTIGLYTKWWHFFLGFSIVGGLGSSLLVNPAIGAISHWFYTRRGLAIGIATTAGSCGGIVFPLTLNALVPKIGFGWATRIVGFICFALLFVANFLTRARLPRITGKQTLPNFTMLKDVNFAITTVGVFFIEIALFVPLAYISTYAISIGTSPSLAFQLLAILNAGSFFGRWLPGFLSDIYGRYNCMCVTLFCCMVFTFGLWLPEVHSNAMIIVFSFFFGVSSGGNISLVSPCLGQLAKPEKLAEYFSCCYCIVAFGSLIGIPIAGSILSASNGSFRGLILFTSLSYLCSFLAFATVRVRMAGWKLSALF